MNLIYFPIIISLFAISFIWFLFMQIKKAPVAGDKATAITSAIQEGVMSYLKRQYKTILIVGIILFILLLFLGWKISVGFLIGAIFSLFSGFISIIVSTQTNTRVAEVAKKSLTKAFDISFKGGLISGLTVISLSLLIISIYYFLTENIQGLIGLAFGTSLISIFARVGGGIYTKAADVGADLVGKIEKKIPEDDSRNPAVIADQVGDNIGDCIGTVSDIFQTHTISIVSTIILGSLLFPANKQFIILPLILGTVSILISIIGSFFVKLGRNKSIMGAMYKGLFIIIVLSAITFYPIILKLMSGQAISVINLYLSVLVGLFLVVGIFIITEYYTSKNFNPVKSIAKASETGSGTNIIRGLGVGMQSIALLVLLIALGIIIIYWLAGIYGISLAIISMLSVSGIVISINAYSPITDNAKGIAEMSNIPEDIKENTNTLNASGNTIKAITNIYATVLAGLVTLVLFFIYSEEISNQGISDFVLNDPKIIIGLLIGGLLPYLFSSILMEAVGKTAGKIVEEVRRQFSTTEGSTYDKENNLMQGTKKPEYEKCINIVTKASIKEMMMPALIPIIAPILVGFILGPEALGGLLIGSIITGLFIGISMIISGVAWDNAKKYIEEGNYGGKGSTAHEAAITGDTVGDPYKDTAGPAINSMIKVLNIVALLIVAFLV